MKSRERYDVFISYRNEGGAATANLIAVKLRNAGYRVFFDVEELREGKFNEQLYAVIEQCRDFVLVLPENALDRCVSPDDWVRLEIERAMALKKNIVPVLLRGFTWPKPMPRGLEEVENYQGVAAGEMSLFDASVAKLKSYLKSRRHFTVKLTKTAAGVVAALGLIAAGVWHWGVVPVCAVQANEMTVKLTRANMLVENVQAAGKAWERFYADYQKASAVEQTNSVAEIRRQLVFSRKQCESARGNVSSFGLSVGKTILLRMTGVDPADITAFHNTFYPELFVDAFNNLDLLEGFLEFEDAVPELSKENSALNVRYVEHAANMLYYGSMGILSVMPRSARKVYEKNCSEWSYFNSVHAVDFSQHEEVYERWVNSEMAKLNRIVQTVASMTTAEQLKFQDMQREQNRLKAKLEALNSEEAQKAREAAAQAAREQASQTLANIQQLTGEVFTRQQQLQELETKIEGTLRTVLEKTVPAPEDGQWLAWGKIVRLATVFLRTAERRRNMERENEEQRQRHKEKGYDVSAGFSVAYTLSVDELLHTLRVRLDEFAQRFPEANGYVPPVRRFYTDVKNGALPLCGLLVMGTKDDLPHPVYKTGDILVSRRGKELFTMADYKSMGNDKATGEDRVTLLRLNTVGNLERIETVVPVNDVLVGFCALKEE